ncbi:RepA [Paspalum striate mosaic virus]|uniref:Replication-associated protein n=1 Tax=Paspalum striate mosaic virus TaxID=1072672 RepID=G1CSA7_9GEMI|nr:RepA [Paspalum striate mosaic virus]AEL29995.1 RepA [Paspalum striate mosaic virus]
MSSLVSETSNSEVGSQMESPGRGGQSIDAPSSSCFKVRARNLFLTYSKCNLTAVFLLEYISSLLKKYCPTYIYVAQEAHKDGSHHLHCIIQCSKYVRTTSAKFFDIKEFHPNVQNPRMPKKALSYCKKSPISEAEYGVFQEIKRPRKKKADAPSTKDAKMAEIIKSSTNKEDYLSMVRKSFPFDWATRLQQFQFSAESLFPSTPPPYVDPFGMPSQDTHPVIGAWLRDELYTVSPYAYSIHNGVSEEQAKLDLQWMSDLSRTEVLLNEDVPSTYVVQQEQERLLGQEVSEVITTGNIPWTSST